MPLVLRCNNGNGKIRKKMLHFLGKRNISLMFVSIITTGYTDFPKSSPKIDRLYVIYTRNVGKSNAHRLLTQVLNRRFCRPEGYA